MMQSTYSPISVDKIDSFFTGASQTDFTPRWSLSPSDEAVTRGIELLKISIAYPIQQTSDYLDLYDLRFQQTQEHSNWTQSEVSSDSITLARIRDEHARRLAAGAFDKNISLADRWAKPNLNLSDEELAAMLDEISSEWEQNFDDLLRED